MDPTEIKERLREAADVLKRLPAVRGPKAFGSNWPDIVTASAETFWAGQWEKTSWGAWRRVKSVLRPSTPTAQEITRMDEALPWVDWLVAEDEIARLVRRHHHARPTATAYALRRQQVVWLRACEQKWRSLQAEFNRSRETLRKAEAEGIARIAEKIKNKAWQGGHDWAYSGPTIRAGTL